MILSIKGNKITKDELIFDAFHLSRPLTFEDMKKLVTVKKKYTMSKSTYERLGKSTKEFLSKRKVKIDFVSKAGRPISSNIETIKKVLELHNAGFSVRKIESKLKIPKSTIHYLIKKAKRNKIKYNGKSVFLD